MKTTKLALFAFVMILALQACKKNKDEEANKAKADLFRSYLDGKQFRAASFVSDKPIDYIQTDSVVKAETDLWLYVKEHIVDDTNIFSDPSLLTIQQNTLKAPMNDTAILTRNYAVTYDKNSVMLEFVDYDYKQLKYRLKDFNDDNFTLYVNFKNEATLYSRFDRID